jgi:hypothetical protein
MRIRAETLMTSDQGLIRATACAIVEKLNAGEITPLLVEHLEANGRGDLRQVQHP